MPIVRPASTTARSFDDSSRRASAWLVAPTLAQPTGFYVLAALVLLERFAGYALGSTLVLYLSARAGYSPADAVRAAGLLNALGYVGTVPGGLLADKVFAHRSMLSLGTALLTLGYALLGSEHAGTLRPALFALSIGGALFRPNTSALLTGCYRQEDARLDAAQMSFYIAANAGAAIGALTAGLLASRGAWSAVFLLAAGAMMSADVLLALTRRQLPKTGEQAASLQPRNAAASPYRTTRRTRHTHLTTMACIALAGVLYAIALGQVEGGLLLWTKARGDRIVEGFEFPAGWVVAMPALLVVLLGPALLRLLRRLRVRVPATQLIAAGLVSIALAFGVLLPIAWALGSMRVGMGWLAGSMALLVIGELLVAPLSMSLLARLAAPHGVALVMGIWYTAVALGAWCGGEIGVLWIRWPAGWVLALLTIMPLLGALLILCQDRYGRRYLSTQLP